MKVIGVGLPRTGTTSLKLALEMLGYGPCYHMTEVFGDAGSWPLWIKAAAGKSPGYWFSRFPSHQRDRSSGLVTN